MLRPETFDDAEVRDAAARPAGVRAWDLPTRLFKWSLVALILVAWIASGSSDPALTVHRYAGIGVLVLVVYRVLWGFVGGTTARFSSFLRPPRAALAYLAAGGRGRRYLGHNPAGGWMIFALLLACGVQALLGLVASDGVMAAGPLADVVGDTVSSLAARIHKIWFYAILGLALVHITANLYAQLVRGENLIGAMITGRKAAAAYVDAQDARPGSPVVAALCLVAAVAVVYLGVTACGGSFLASP